MLFISGILCRFAILSRSNTVLSKIQPLVLELSKVSERDQCNSWIFLRFIIIVRGYALK